MKTELSGATPVERLERSECSNLLRTFLTVLRT
jgi:hypothetical protein